MSYTEGQLLGFCKSTLVGYIQSIQTWTSFKNFLNTITKAKLKTKLKTDFQNRGLENDNSILKHQEQKANNLDAETKIDNL